MLLRVWYVMMCLMCVVYFNVCCCVFDVYLKFHSMLLCLMCVAVL